MKWVLLISLLYGARLDQYVMANYMIYNTEPECYQAMTRFRSAPRLELEYGSYDMNCVPAAVGNNTRITAGGIDDARRESKRKD